MIHFVPAVEGDTLTTMRCRMLTWELKDTALVPERTEKLSKPQSDPKVIKIALDGHLKAYGIYGVVATSGHLWRGWELIFFLLGLRAPNFF